MATGKNSTRYQSTKTKTPAKSAQSCKGGKPYNVADKQSRWAKSAETNLWKNGPDNHKEWYNHFMDQVRNYANYNFLVPVGSKINLGADAISADRYPGVMALYFAPAAGDNVDGNANVINLAANQLYQFVRFENNGSSEYDRGDLMLYLLAMDSCYMYLAYLKRLYGMITEFSSMNRYFPRALIRANRVDYDDLEVHLAEFRAFINRFGDRLAQLPIPGSMAYMKRHTWMAENMFVDEDTRKCQIYMYVPQYFYKFGIEAEGEWAGAPYLDYVNPSYDKILTFEDLRSFANELLDPLVENEDFNLIGADIIKAFGTGGLLRVEPIEDDYRTSPIYSEEVLDQIQNACAMGHPATMPVNGFSLNGGHAVFWNPTNNRLVPCNYTWCPFDLSQTYQIGVAGFEFNRLINFEKDDITNDDIMVATRLTTTASGEFIEGAGYALTLHGLGSELFCQYSMFFFTDADTGEFRIGNTTYGYYVHPDISVLPDSQPESTADELRANIAAAISRGNELARDRARWYQCITQFNRHPSVMNMPMFEYVYDDDGETKVRGMSAQLWRPAYKRIGDVANYAFFTKEDLEDLSGVALMSEFYVPMSASGPVAITGGNKK